MPDQVTETLTAWRKMIELENSLDTTRTPISSAVPRLVAAVEAAMGVAAKHEHGATRWADPLPVPSWIPELREAISGALLDQPSTSAR